MLPATSPRADVPSRRVTLTTKPSLPPLAVIWSGYNARVTAVMRDAAIENYAARGGDPADLAIVEAPGAFELTALSNAAARSAIYAGIVAIGCVIKGETEHDRHIASAVATGLTGITVATGVPVAFGVLTVNTPEQALARAGLGDRPIGNKGAEAMTALLDTLEAAHAIASAATTAKPGLRFDRTGSAPDKAAKARAN